MLSNHLPHVYLVILPLLHLLRHLLIVLDLQHRLQVLILLQRGYRVLLVYQLEISRDHRHGRGLHVLILVGRARVHLGRPERLFLARSHAGLPRQGVLDVNL